jgi:hypothetical protein
MVESKKIEVNLTNCETLMHIANVSYLLNTMVIELLQRGENHDLSKMSPEEVDIFADYTSKLKACTYGSDEYKANLAAMKPALDHHYSKNRHHPEHFSNGIQGMTLIDLIEMICDWKAASVRHADGSLMKSIQYNVGRFDIGSQLQQILENTALMMEPVE